ncbi:ATPase [Paracoccaceae bacterium]|jgi:chaperone required for assembly of F1-ATPase|nr:ATPase [Paracoccaceae bacterium]
MSGWTKKRFWQDATVVQTTAGFTVHLDDKALKTPAKADFIVPTRLLADAVATEWQAQGDIVKPDEMPVTRTVNSALDKVTPAHSQVADLVADYAGFDLICYRADTPQALIDRQAEAWDPLVTWSAQALLAQLNVSYGLMPVVQPAESLARLRSHVHAVSAFQLAALHDLVALSGSLVIGLAAAKNHLKIERLWALSRVDESWQVEQWGEDEIAITEASIKREAFYCAQEFFNLCR